MTIREWFVEYEFHADRAGAGTFAGKLTQGDVDDMEADSKLTTDEWWAAHGR